MKLTDDAANDEDAAAAAAAALCDGATLTADSIDCMHNNRTIHTSTLYIKATSISGPSKAKLQGPLWRQFYGMMPVEINETSVTRAIESLQV